MKKKKNGKFLAQTHRPTVSNNTPKFSLGIVVIEDDVEENSGSEENVLIKISDGVKTVDLTLLIMNRKQSEKWNPILMKEPQARTLWMKAMPRRA